jgi:hypothetical protein
MATNLVPALRAEGLIVIRFSNFCTQTDAKKNILTKVFMHPYNFLAHLS